MKKRSNDHYKKTTNGLMTQYYNFLAIQILEHIGIAEPNEQQIDFIEQTISNYSVQVKLNFHHELNKKEIACLYWAARGKSSNETAKLLKVSQSTVEAYRKEIKRKLNCANIAQAVFEGLRYVGFDNLAQYGV